MSKHITDQDHARTSEAASNAFARIERDKVAHPSTKALQRRARDRDDQARVSEYLDIERNPQRADPAQS